MARKKSLQSPDEETTENLEVDVDTIIKELSKKFGKGVAFQGGQQVEEYNKGVISTGILSLDLALRIGGYPLGRTIEVFGNEATGKTTLALRGAAEALKLGFLVFYIDMEHSLDLTLAQHIGININDKKFCVAQPDCGEEAMDIIETVLRSGARSYIVLDSIAALVTKSELEKGFLDPSQPARQAALMSTSLRKLTGVISTTSSTLLFVNQIRHKIGMMMGAQTVTPGGAALKFYSSIRIKLTTISQLTLKEQRIGHTARVRIEKNKLAAPFAETALNLYYGSGFSATNDILKMAISDGIVKQTGSWYAYEGTRIGQGELNILNFLVKTPDVYREIRNRVMESRKLPIPKDNIYFDQYLIYNGEKESEEADKEEANKKDENYADLNLGEAD